VNSQKNISSITQTKEIWQLILHRKWIVLLAGVLLCAAAIIAVSLLPNWYMASTTILVDPQKMPDRYTPDSVTMDQLRSDAVADEVLSSVRLQQIIDELRLYPELRDRMTPTEIIDYMRKYVTVEVRSGGEHNLGTFTISYKGKDPKVVAQVVTRLTDSFMQWNLAAREHEAVGASEFVSTQLVEAKKTMDEQEAKVNAFTAQHLGELPEQLQPHSAALSRLQDGLQANADALNRLDMERTLLTQSSGAGSVTERSRLEDEQQKLVQELSDLRSRYSDEYPEVVQANDRLTEVRERLAHVAASTGANPAADSSGDPRLAAVKREINYTQQERQRILAQIAKFQAEVEIMPLRQQQLRDLNRDYENAKTHYLNLLDKSFAAGMATDLERKKEAQRFSILEPVVVPEKPFKPRRFLMISLLIPFCFLLSATIVVVFEKMRGTIGTEPWLRTLLPSSVIVVGWIPEIETPLQVRRERRVASVAITASLLCGIMTAVILSRVHHLHM
jgi:polysaccharide chain length determinant protein (PEP-CTERM system associated)